MSQKKKKKQYSLCSNFCVYFVICIFLYFVVSIFFIHDFSRFSSICNKNNSDSERSAKKTPIDKKMEKTFGLTKKIFSIQ